MAVLDSLITGEAVGTLESGAFLVASLASVGVLGVMDSLLGDGNDDVPDDGGDGDDMFADDEVADGGGDAFAFDDDGGGGGDEFDDFDMGGVDDDAMGGGGDMVGLESDMEELESEIESLSSTVSTVRAENEQIGESVQEVEENVRKLLDIYEMVTKGVNPFADREGAESGPAAGGDGLGLFDEDEESDESDLDEEVTDADAEEFFDDDFDDDELDEDLDAEDPDDTVEADEGGKSFDDLREEYEEPADWEEDAAEEAAEAATDEPTPQPAPEGEREKPYLESVPAGYVTDLLVIEWIEYLVGEGSPSEASRAITYYENVEWISRSAADRLREYLDAPAVDPVGTEDARSLTMEHHTTSLWYIARVNGDLTERGLGEWTTEETQRSRDREASRSASRRRSTPNSST